MLTNFKVFTLNCWGLAVVSKNRRQRIQAIANILAKNNYDVVCLQEVWRNTDYLLIKEAVSDVLPYCHYFYSGVVGSGICIFSKHIIEETFFHQWSVNGYIHKLHHGDWWAGKGVGLCQLKVIENTKSHLVNVYSAHLHAEYNRASDDYQAHRVLQAYDTAQFILLTSNTADLVILAADLNTEPGDLAYKLILNIPDFTDAFTEKKNLPQDLYATCESPKNSYTPSSLVDKKLMGKRIDYIMYHCRSNFLIDLNCYELPLPDRVPSKTFSYSDHEAVLIQITLKTNEQQSIVKRCADNEIKKQILEECIGLCDQALQSIARTRFFYGISVLILTLLILVFFTMSISFMKILTNGYSVIPVFITFILTILLIFCLLMETIWSAIEKHGVLSGKIAMEKSLNKLKTCDDGGGL